MIRRSGLVVAFLGGLGCGPVVQTPSDDASGSSTAAVSGGSSTGAPAPGDGSSSGGAEGSTTVPPDPGGYEDDDGGTGCTFTCPDPSPPTPPPGGNGWCGLSCPQGEKCMPWANDGGMAWNTFRCSPLADDPGAPGEPCQVEGSQWSGIDDCDVDTICWQVDPRTNEGVCHGVCGVVDGSTFGCPAPLDCTILDAGVPLCVQGCDPLAPDCPEGQACAFASADLVCQAVVGEPAAVGEPCGPDVACEPGTLCSYDPALDCADEPGVGCCAAPCDVSDPAACMGPEVCVPWFPLRPPPELAHLGVCATP